MERWQERTLRLTVVLVVASLVLIVPGLAGIAASPLLVGGVLLLSIAGFAVRERLAVLPEVFGHRLGRYGQDLWLGPLVVLVALLLVPGASPEELQALGGIVGFVGMINYFLRPVYFLVYSLLKRLAASG